MWHDITCGQNGCFRKFQKMFLYSRLVTETRPFKILVQTPVAFKDLRDTTVISKYCANIGANK